ncbi:MAG: hypothetical protein WBM76_04760, partial [Woeseiaceae bacterium]
NYCKHRMAIFDGNTKAVVSENADQVNTVLTWLSGTDVAEALDEFREIEKLKDVSKSELVAAKRKLARAMNS